jgi:hypothetical protein
MVSKANMVKKFNINPKLIQHKIILDIIMIYKTAIHTKESLLIVILSTVLIIKISIFFAVYRIIEMVHIKETNYYQGYYKIE